MGDDFHIGRFGDDRFHDRPSFAIYVIILAIFRNYGH